MTAVTAEIDDLNQLSDDEFRMMVRQWIAGELSAGDPQSAVSGCISRIPKPGTTSWRERAGCAPNWPREFGGMGIVAGKQLIMLEEKERHGCARLNEMGMTMLGPLADPLRHARNSRTSTCRRSWPANISGARVIPNRTPGSDLASLRTEAVLDGDDWVVNGQKIWTSLAMDANWIFLLVRTDKQAKKQEGISFLLVPMDSPGITVRPITNLDMEDEFCETFFDNVRVPKENLVGQINKGWTMAKNLLGFERIGSGSPRQSSYALGRLRLLADRMGVWEDDRFQDRYTRLRLDLEDHKALYSEFVAKVYRGEALGPDVSMLKVHQTELYQRITETMLEIAGEYGGQFGPLDGNRELNPAGLFIQSRPSTIYAGSNEIQRNILAKNVLELPG